MTTILFENIVAGTEARVEADYVAESETEDDAGAVPESEAEAETPHILLARTEILKTLWLIWLELRLGLRLRIGRG